MKWLWAGITKEMQREVSIIGLLNIHLDYFQNLYFNREEGDKNLEVGEGEIEMGFKEVLIIIEIQTFSQISRSLFKIILDSELRSIKFNKSLKVFWIDWMKDLKKDKVFHGMKWTKSMEVLIKILTRDRKMTTINGDF